MLDFVPNHTSDLHPWFEESRASRESAKRDWYLWRDGDPPNNWIAVFGGPAWEWDEATGQSYYHAYLPEQPDLNWRNPEVREAMLARAAVLEGARGGRLPGRRDAPGAQGPLAARQPAGAGLRRARRTGTPR